MVARIFRPGKTAMQSGRAKTGLWALEFEKRTARTVEPLMGYTSSGDMRQQLRLSFQSKEDAIAYAEREGIAYQVEEPAERKVRPAAYSDNFLSTRIGLWTH